jgi:hypothetical protein
VNSGYTPMLLNERKRFKSHKASALWAVMAQ